MLRQPVTAVEVQARKGKGQRLVMLTAYDATFASILDAAGIDILLVGDSLGMVVQGQPNTLPVTLDHMIYHCQAVSRGAQSAHVVGDLPFLSYQTSVQDAVHSAGRLVKEGGAHAVKLEGGAEMADRIVAIVRMGVPVMGHIGLTPQSVHRMGGFKVQGRDNDTARRLLADAKALQDAGCYALVLEGIPTELAARITQCINIPTIGIGAGAGCDGQVLVCYDLLGMNPNFKPRFVKHYDNLFKKITKAASAFAAEVRDGTFPSKEHSFRSKTLTLADVEEAPAADELQPLYSVPM